MEKAEIKPVCRDHADLGGFKGLRKHVPPSLQLDHLAADMSLSTDDAVKSSLYYSASVIPFLSPLVLSPTSPSPDVAKEEWDVHRQTGKERSPQENPERRYPSDAIRSSFDKPGPGCLCSTIRGSFDKKLGSGCLCSAFESQCILQPEIR